MNDSPLEIVLSDVEKALENRLFYLAVAVALTIPDICSALESSDRRTSSDKYKDWFTKWLQEDFSFLSSDDLYSLRCGVVHQANFGTKHQYESVVFALSGQVLMKKLRFRSYVCLQLG